MSTSDEKRDTVRAVSRAIDILQVFTFTNKKLTLAEICGMLDLPKTTIYRVLTTLEQRNVVSVDAETGKYHLGYEMIKMGAIAQDSNTLSSVAREDMIEISRLTEQTCNLYVRIGLERLCIAQITGSQYVKRYSYLGARHPLYCGAGKILLAYAGEDFQKEFFSKVKLEQFTQRTVTDVAALKRELALIRERGYSVTLGERDAETAMAAVPLFDYAEKVVATVTVSGPVYYFTEENIKKYVDCLREFADKISARLGYVKKI